MKIQAILCISLVIVTLLNSQVNFTNPSFETTDTFSTGYAPINWSVFRYSPDVLPNNAYTRGRLFFIHPNDGITYVGLRASDGTYTESLGQRVSTTLLSATDYHFLVDFATDTRLDANSSRYPFRVYAGSTLCDTSQIIYSAPRVDTFWRRLVVQFRLARDAEYITFSSTGCTPASSCIGYIFLDNLSPIYTGIYTGITSSTPLEEGLWLFPNPTNGYQMFISEQPIIEPSRLIYYDIKGKPVSTFMIAKGASILDIELELPNGVYFARIQNNTEDVLLGKIVLIRD